MAEMKECHMGLVVEMVLPPGCFSVDYGMVVQRDLIRGLVPCEN